MRGLALGLDLSLTSTGVAGVLVADGVVQRSWATALRPRKLRGVERLAWYRDQIERLPDLLISGDDLYRPPPEWPVVVAIEGYAYGAHAQREALGELGGVVRLTLADWGRPFVVVPPAVLKKFVTGKGNAKKEVVRLEAFKRFQVEAETSDEVEAECLALLLAQGLGWVDLGLPQVNLESLKKVDWPEVA